MRYWDSSAILPLYVEQPATASVRRLLELDGVVTTWTLSDIEVRSGLHRLDRTGALDPGDIRLALERHEALWSRTTTVGTVSAVAARARRLLGRHPLRAADALQLGAALTATYDNPGALDFVCIDDRLRAAAALEGFRVLP